MSNTHMIPVGKKTPSLHHYAINLYIISIMFFFSIQTSFSQKTERIILPNQQGKCLDGSPPGYYLRRGFGTGAKNWIIYFEGGGWCFNERECRLRSRRKLGSSIPRSDRSLWFGGGILSSNIIENPNFYNWNVVYAFYCDGAAFAGTKGPVKLRTDGRLFFSGHFNLKSIADDLAENKKIGSASRVLVTGCSAGAHTVAFGCNVIAKAAPHSKVKCMMDAGLFADAIDLNGQRSFRKRAQGLFGLQGMSGGVETKCRRANQWNQWKCFFPQVHLSYVKVPVFLINSIYDPTAISIVLNKGVKLDPAFRSCLNSPNFNKCSRKIRRKILSYGNFMGRMIRKIVRRQRKSGLKSASFVMTNINHCSTIYSSWSKVRGSYQRYGQWTQSGPTLRQAISNWVYDN